MKKLLASIIVLVIVIMFNSTSATAAEYVVVKSGSKTTIHKINEYGNNTVDVSTYDFVNPTLSQLSDIDLPSHCWPWVNGGDGAYDTRLIKAEQDLNEMKANYENEKETVAYLENQKVWSIVWLVVSGIAIIVLLIKVIPKRKH